MDEIFARERALVMEALVGAGMIQSSAHFPVYPSCDDHQSDTVKVPSACSSKRHGDAGLSKSQNPSELRLLGNQHFQQGYFDEAVMYYSEALDHPQIDDNDAFGSDKVSCLSNRAEVNLRLERWELALEDALEALKIEPDHVKSQFRLAKALSRTGRPTEALGLLLEIVKRGGVCPVRAHEIDVLSKDCRRIAYEEGGDYDIPSMMKEASERPAGSQRLSSFHATFCSPEVAIGVPIEIPSSGKSYRGCKALSNLKEGELIMSSKAFAIGLKHSISIMMNEVVQKLQNEPSLAKEFFSLSDGRDTSSLQNYQDKSVNTYANLDRVRDIIRINNFGMLRYDAGIRENWNSLQDRSQQREDPLATSETVFGLYINESMINNSCTPNCQWLNIGDQIFIYTTKPVQAGEELSIDYFPTDGSYRKRFERFSNWIRPGHGFECVCDHCELLRSRDDLFRLGNQVHDGILQAQAMQHSHGITQEQAFQAVFPPSRRREIFGAFSHLPLRLQHTQIANLHEMEGRILAAEGDLQGSLEANQRVAEINYEVRGSGKWDYFMEQWCIAGLAIVCQNLDLARESLEKVWNSPAFQAYPKEEAELMFRDLTHAYAARQLPLDPHYVTEIETQIGSVIALVLKE